MSDIKHLKDCIAELAKVNKEAEDKLNKAEAEFRQALREQEASLNRLQ